MAIWTVIHRGVRTKHTSARQALAVVENIEKRELEVPWTSRVPAWAIRKHTGQMYGIDSLRELVNIMIGRRRR